jgi:hypothetical protein
LPHLSKHHVAEIDTEVHQALTKVMYRRGRKLKLLQAGFLVIFLTTCAHADPSTADLVASAPYVPPPSALPSVPSQEWCKIVDAALANPNTPPARKEEYIAVGQTNHCPHQMMMEPRKRVEPSSLTPQQWCDNAFRLLANQTVDPYFKQATLEKMRNRGCLR